MIRPAEISDSSFIAWVILTAVGFENPDEEILDGVTKICRRDDTLYSWRNTFIAEIEGKAVGSITCYDGSNYRAMREITFPIIAQNSGNDFSGMEMETMPGEFYLDSMAVLPKYRHRGIATSLLKEGIRQAQLLGLTRAAMVVSPENPDAQRLYESLGFAFEREMFLFNETYRKMVKHL